MSSSEEEEDSQQLQAAYSLSDLTEVLDDDVAGPAKSSVDKSASVVVDKPEESKQQKTADKSLQPHEAVKHVEGTREETQQVLSPAGVSTSVEEDKNDSKDPKPTSNSTESSKAGDRDNPTCTEESQVTSAVSDHAKDHATPSTLQLDSDAGIYENVDPPTPKPNLRVRRSDGFKFKSKSMDRASFTKRESSADYTLGDSSDSIDVATGGDDVERPSHESHNSPSPSKSMTSVKSDIGGRLYYDRSPSPARMLDGGDSDIRTENLPENPSNSTENTSEIDGNVTSQSSDQTEFFKDTLQSPDNSTDNSTESNSAYSTARRTMTFPGAGGDTKVKVLPDGPPAVQAVRRQKQPPENEGAHHTDQEGIYEPVIGHLSCSTGYDDDLSWGSSEFESYDEEEEENVEEQTTQRNSQVIEVKVTHRSSKNIESTVLDKLAANLKIGSKGQKKVDELEDDLTYVEVTLDPEKHPPPQLPPVPMGLESAKLKRRHIVASIVESENSYVASLKRIVEEYEKPLLPIKHPIIPKSAVNVIFFKVRDILQCHNMFHIELAEAIHCWDDKEEIGNIFTASFSKSMVFDVYSAYVNNFTEAMETAKKLARQKPAFSEFLKDKIIRAHDKLSLYGLMVKPVQRFPQFILLLQDLLKHTPKDHHDRLALQLALSELENLTFKLNEMKRESENIRDVKLMLSCLTGRYHLKTDYSRYLLRQDDVLQLDCSHGEKNTKPRRLFLLSDQLICASVLQKDTDNGYTEKYKVKWSVPIQEIEVVQAVLNTFYQVKSGPGRTTIVAPKLDKTTFTPWKKDLDDMLHDLPVIEHMAQLSSQLRLEYEGVTAHMFEDLHRSLQLMIQQHSNIDNCILQLALPSNPSRPAKIHVTFQMVSPGMKQEWLVDLKNARLALDPRNNPAWYIPEAEQTHTFKLPLFIKPLLIDITKFNSKIQCAIPVLIPNPNNPYVSTQHLWVCSSEPGRGQVTVVAIHTDQPHVIESFQASHMPISCAEAVPGYAVVNDEYAFCQDTVWMALDNNQMIIHKVLAENREDPVEAEITLDTEDMIINMKYLDSRLYAGLRNGTLLVFCRDQDGVWDFDHKLRISLGPDPITCILAINHEIWASCGSNIHTISVTTRIKQDRVSQEVEQNVHQVGFAEGELVECMVTAGTGLLVSFRNKSNIRIFCLETFHPLQDVNIASVIDKVVSGKILRKDAASQDRNIRITYMLASRGLLWVGTDNGCVATLPLPRLEGIPQIKGRPCVSYHAHNGPIRFLVPIHCGATPVRHPMSWIESETNSEDREMDLNTDDGMPPPNELEGINITGVTEGESYDFKPFTQSDTYDDVVAQVRTSDLSNPSIHSHHSDDQNDDNAEHHQSHNDSDMTVTSKQRRMSETRWSTPDLRQGFASFEEDVISLYGNLLQSSEVEAYEHDLLEPRRRRPFQDAHIHYFPVQHSSMVRRRTGRNKYLTLPAVKEQNAYDSNEPLSPINGGQRLEEGVLHPNRTPTVQSNRGAGDVETLGVAPVGGSASAARPVIVVSGGEGHINWSQKNAGDNRYEDICLLMWQCQT